MTDFVISAGKLNPVSDISGAGRLVASFTADFTGANNTVLLDMTSQQLQQTFLNARTIFFDNSANANPVTVSVSITQHIFTIPARSVGFYPLTAGQGSKILMTSVGGASAFCTGNLYNYEIPPVVWYATGSAAGTVTASIADGADVAEGAKADAAIVNPATAGSVIAFLKGILTTLLAPLSFNPYPIGSTPKIGGQSGAAAALTATLGATAAKTNYISGFEVTGLGATAAGSVAVTVTGLLGGTQTYTFPVPIGPTVGAFPLLVEFSPPLPASAVNVAIAVNVPSFGAGNTAASVVAHGFCV